MQMMVLPVPVVVRVAAGSKITVLAGAGMNLLLMKFLNLVHEKFYLRAYDKGDKAKRLQTVFCNQDDDLAAYSARRIWYKTWGVNVCFSLSGYSKLNDNGKSK